MVMGGYRCRPHFAGTTAASLSSALAALPLVGEGRAYTQLGIPLLRQ